MLSVMFRGNQAGLWEDPDVWKTHLLKKWRNSTFSLQTLCGHVVPSAAERKKLLETSALLCGVCCSLRHSSPHKSTTSTSAFIFTRVLPVRVCLCPPFPFDKRTSHMGPGPTLMASLQFEDLCKDPLSNLEGLMLKLKLQYFGHLMQRTDSLKRLYAGKD